MSKEEAVSRPSSDEQSSTQSQKQMQYSTTLVVLQEMLKENGDINIQCQIDHVHCLYQESRYEEALQMIRQYQDLGNTAKDLTYLKGRCLFKLKQWEGAMEVFSEDDIWNRWQAKAIVMFEIETGRQTSIEIGPEPLQYESNFDKDDIFEWSQTDNEILITLGVSFLQQKDVEIEMYPVAIDIVLKKREEAFFQKSIELYSMIDTEHPKVSILQDRVEIRCSKVDTVQWPSLAFEDVNPMMSEGGLANFLPKLEQVPILSDQEAAAQFETIQKTVMGDPSRVYSSHA